MGQEAIHAAPCSSSNVEQFAPRRRRKKRGGFKAGILKRRKSHMTPPLSRSSSQCSSPIRCSSRNTTGSEDFADVMENVLTGDLSYDQYDTDSRGHYSCQSTLPSEGDKTGDDDDEHNKKDDFSMEKGESMQKRKKRGRKKRGIGRRSKLYWKKESGTFVEQTGDSHAVPTDCVSDDKKDVGTSVTIDMRESCEATSASSTGEDMT